MVDTPCTGRHACAVATDVRVWCPAESEGRVRSARTTTGFLATVALVAGCGSDADHANEPRPARPIHIPAAITAGRITVSPNTFGAGTVVLLIANETSQAHRVTVESDEL